MAQPTSDYYEQLQTLLAVSATSSEQFETIVNAPFHDPVQATHLDLGIVVLLLVNPETRTIDRIALSDTDQAKGAVKMSEKPFESIKIPLDDTRNLIAKAIAQQEPQRTTDWKDLFIPALAPQAARFNQAGAGIECSFVYPLPIPQGGALIFSYYQPPANIGAGHAAFMKHYCSLVAQCLA